MKVLHVIPSLSLAQGGPSRAMRLIEQALLARGIEVATATTDDDGPGRRIATAAEMPLVDEFVGGPPLCPSGCPGRLVSNEIHRGGGAAPTGSTSLKIVRRYFPKRLEFYKVSPEFARWIFPHVRDYDLVHIHALFSFTSVAAAWAARRAGVPYVIRPLGTLNQYGVTQRRPWLKQLSLKLVEGPILRHAAAVHFTAEAERVEADAVGVPMRGVVVPLGVAPLTRQDASVFLQRFPQLSGRRIVLFLSRLDPKKNVEGLLQAFSLVSESLTDTRLAIAGDGEPEYVAGLKRLADELGLADRVVWAGFVDGELKAGAFAAAQAFVLPSFSENFGIAAAEALMAGLPCVLGEGVAIADEVARAGAGVVTAPDPQAVAQALRKLLGDDARLTEMAQRARALASGKYSLEAMGANLHALYSRILAQNPTGQIE
ncbi:MAG: glycosyltransferase [Thiobacillus sp.]|nr:glycosyltransferase [Thiobacillus sp.]